MKLIMIRHGESKANVWGGMYADDRMNFLSLRGSKQAELAAYTVKDLAPDGLDRVYTSTLNRARHTTSIIMQGVNDWQRHYEQDDRLMEWCWNAPGSGNWYDWETEADFRVRIADWFQAEMVPLWETDLNVLIVSHYYTMEGLMDEIALHKGLVSDYTPLDIHGHVNIPNAIPYFMDTKLDDNPVIILPGQKAVAR